MPQAGAAAKRQRDRTCFLCQQLARMDAFSSQNWPSWRSTDPRGCFLMQRRTDRHSKPDRLLTAIRVRSFETAAEAFAELDRIGERLHGFDIPGDAIDHERR
jgi:hypothetical protein